MTDTTTEQPDRETSGARTSSTLGTLATALAVVLIGGYVLALGLMALNADIEEMLWLRRSDLLGGLEALAFAGAGALFGTSVQRRSTEKAEDQAADNKERADRSEADAQRGRAVYAAAQAMLPPAGARALAAGQPSPIAELLAVWDNYPKVT